MHQFGNQGIQLTIWLSCQRVTLSAIISIPVDLCRIGFSNRARALKLDGTGSLREADLTTHLRELLPSSLRGAHIFRGI